MVNHKMVSLSGFIFISLLAYTNAQTQGIVDSLATYISQSLTNFRDVMKSGLPEFGIKPLEPIKLDNMSFAGSSTGVTITFANFTNVTLYGLSTMQVSKVSVKSTNRNLNLPLHMALQLKFDNWTMTGFYNMSGRVIGFIPLHGDGAMEMELTEVLIDASGNLTANPNGTYNIKPDGMTSDLQAGDIKMHFHGFYGGGTMSGIANNIANFFSGRIFDHIKPTLIEKMTTTLQSSINRKLENIKLI